MILDMQHKHSIDVQLAAAWGAGNARAADLLVRTHRAWLIRFFATKVGDSEGEDLVQETLLQAHRAVRMYRGMAGFRTFLRAIAQNVLKQHYRKKKTSAARGRATQTYYDETANLGAAMLEAPQSILPDEQLALLEALDKLSPPEFELLALGLETSVAGTAGAAEALGISKTTAARHHRAVLVRLNRMVEGEPRAPRGPLDPLAACEREQAVLEMQLRWLLVLVDALVRRATVTPYGLGPHPSSRRTTRAGSCATAGSRAASPG